MIAIQYDGYGPAEVLRPAVLPTPVPARDQVLVRLHAAGVAPIDWKLRAGFLKQFFTPDFPKVPGRDGAGTVVAVGEDVSEFSLGQRVGVMTDHHMPGSYAQFAACPADRVVPIGDIAFAEAASLINAGLSAWIAGVETAQIEPGMKVLVHGGSGAVGGILVQLARHLGAEVTATCRADNVDYVLSLGAQRAIAYDREDFSTLRDLDVVVDMVGGAVHDSSYRVLRPDGHLVYLVAAPIRDRGGEFGVRVSRAMVSDRRAPVEQIIDLAARGVIRPQVAGLMPLEQAAEAHRRMEAGAVSRGRLILTMPEEEE